MTRVAIVGAGIGGLAAAVCLHEAGIEVTVLEQAPALGEVGAGVNVTPNASRQLHRLGFEADLRERSVSTVGMEIMRWEDSSVIARVLTGAASERAFGVPWYTVYRPDLIDILYSRLPTGTVRLGARCVGVDQDDTGVTVRVEDGAAETADILVGADGHHSYIRESVIGSTSARFGGHVAYRAMVPRSRLDGLLDLLEPTIHTHVGPDHHFVAYPVRRDLQLLNLNFLVRQEDWPDSDSWTEQGSLEELRRAFAGWSPLVQSILDRVEAPIFRWGLFDRLPMPSWTRGRITLLGDACHPMLPHQGQGANMAIEDAVVLADCLQDHSDDLATALARYEALRIPRTSWTQAGSWRNRTVFHLPDGPEQQARDAAWAEGSSGMSDYAELYGFDVHDPRNRSANGADAAADPERVVNRES